ncbi:MAG: inorganic diphosphatase [Candidatus Thioglobus sp.]|nr:MAG: inorganic diphosphatase [Candidatus Thioglobus sp.]KAA0446134.1 MAG: inorganic diphosphatase [Candidatus Thioglobus sp.]
MQNNLKPVSAGNVPDEVNVIIEIPANSSPVKYEIDKQTGAMFVDRFITTPMFYPCNYGFVPETLAEDGDPADVLVITPYPLIHDSVIRARPIGVLRMTDEAGQDYKILAVPVDKLCKSYHKIQDIGDVDQTLKDQIEHFFTYYKDLDEGKWVKIDGWGDIKEAKKALQNSFDCYQN